MGSIRKRGNRYQAQVRRSGQQSIGKSFVLRQDAERWIREIEAKMDRGEFREYQSPTLLLGNLLERYMEEITSAKKGRDAETRRLKRLIRDEIASTTLSQLSGPILAKFRDRRIKDGIARELDASAKWCSRLFLLANPTPTYPRVLRVRFAWIFFCVHFARIFFRVR